MKTLKTKKNIEFTILYFECAMNFIPDMFIFARMTQYLVILQVDGKEQIPMIANNSFFYG